MNGMKRPLPTVTPLARMLKHAVEPVLSLVYPDRCQICAMAPASVEEGYVCAACWSRRGAIRFLRPPWCERCGLPFEGDITNAFVCANCQDLELHFDHARAAVAADGLVRDVIHRYKYERALWFEPFLADLLRRAAVDEIRGGRWDWIVPVPLHWLKEREREFNQADRLAGCLSRMTGVPVNNRCLRRVRPTQTQTELSRRERSENVHGAFAFAGKAGLAGASVILVDDVMTTGATTSACAAVLRKNGAEKVCVWTVARGLLVR